MKIENVGHENDHKVSSSVLSNLSTLRKVFFAQDSKPSLWALPSCPASPGLDNQFDKSENRERIFMLKIF